MSASPPAKRAKLDTDSAAAPAEIAAAPGPAPASTAADSAPARTAFELALDQESPDSLFGTIRSTLGKLAATEPQVGITQFVGNDIPSFTGIIKHRSVTFSTRRHGRPSWPSRLTGHLPPVLTYHSFTDFLVYEIGLDGEPVRLKSLDGPTQPKQPEPVAPVEPVNQVSSPPLCSSNPDEHTLRPCQLTCA